MPHRWTVIRSRGRSLAALGLLVALSLTACAGEDPVEPPPLADPSATPSATPTPSPSGPPPLPAAARGTSDQAAIAFVRHWVATLNYAAETLDTGPLESLQSDTCVACSSIVERLATVRENQGSVDGIHWQLVEPNALREAGPTQTVQGVIETSPSVVVPSPGATPVKSASSRAFASFEVRPGANGWTLVGMTVELS